jgi:hypothetical protein
MAVSPVVGSNASLGPDVTAQTACLQAAKAGPGADASPERSVTVAPQ